MLMSVIKISEIPASAILMYFTPVCNRMKRWKLRCMQYGLLIVLLTFTKIRLLTSNFKALYVLPSLLVVQFI